MAEPDNIVLVYLRRIDEKVDRVIDDVRDLKVRMTEVEERLARVELSIAGYLREEEFEIDEEVAHVIFCDDMRPILILDLWQERGTEQMIERDHLIQVLQIRPCHIAFPSGVPRGEPFGGYEAGLHLFACGV